MSYTLIKTNGTTLTTVADASLNVTTDLQFVGRNYSGYGAPFNENFLKLLENFNNTTPPAKPIQGELWFDSSNKSLNVCYDGKNFKSLANMYVQGTQPASVVKGDMWWDTSNNQLKTFDGSSFLLIGPQLSSKPGPYWTSVAENTNVNSQVTVLEAKYGNITAVTVSNQSQFTLADGITSIQKGITLPGAAAGTAGTPGAGSTQASGYYFWGTSAESLFSKNILAGTAGQLVYQSAVGTTSFVRVGTPGQVLISGGTNGPSFSNFSDALPTATPYALGAVKVDAASIVINSGVISVANMGVFPSQSGHGGQYLTTDGAGNLSWASVVSGSGVSSLSALSDVSLSSPTSGQVLKYNGSVWVNGTDNTGGGTGLSITNGNWTISINTVADKVIFTHSGVVKASINANGDFTVAGDIIAFGSP